MINITQIRELNETHVTRVYNHNLVLDDRRIVQRRLLIFRNEIVEDNTVFVCNVDSD